MKIKHWNEMTFFERVASVIGLISSVGVLLFALLQLFGVWENALDAAIPLMGVMLAAQALREWRGQRSVAILSLVTAAVVFGCAIAVWIL